MFNLVQFMELYASVTGPSSASPIILLHGLFGDSDNLIKLSKALSSHYQVHALDLRNHGRSPHQDEMNYQVMAQDALDYMVKNDLERPALFGHSMGGKVVMQLALTIPDRISKLIVADIAPVTYRSHHDDVFAGFDAADASEKTSRSSVDASLAKAIDVPAVRQFLLKSLVKNNNGKFDWRFNLNSIRENYPSILSGIDSKARFDGEVLFIFGELSDYIKPEYKEAITALFPNARSKMIQGAGHWLHAEKPELFNQLCLRFLQA